MYQKLARGGIEYLEFGLFTLAARWRVSGPVLKVATAELINTADKAFSFL